MTRAGLAAVVAGALLMATSQVRAGGVAVALPPDACSPDHDSSPAIEAILSRTPNGQTVEFPSGGRCLVARTLDLSIPPSGAAAREDTAFHLNGATIFRTEEPSCRKIGECNGPIVSLHDVRHVVLEDGAIAGGGATDGLPSFDATREHDHGVAVHGASGVQLFRLSIRDVGGDCVDVDRHDKVDTSDVAIERLTCTGAGRQGVSANAVAGLRILRSTFDRIAATAVDLEPRRSGFIRQALVAQNRFGWVGNYAVAGIGSSSEWADVRVADNVQTGEGLAFLRAGNSFDRGPLTITGNRMRGAVQINHTSGSATGNLLLDRPAGGCLFELYNDPPFEVRANLVPSGVRETCAFRGKIAAHTLRQRVTHALKVGLVVVIAVALALVTVAVLLLLLLRRRRPRLRRRRPRET